MIHNLLKLLNITSVYSTHIPKESYFLFFIISFISFVFGSGLSFIYISVYTTF